MAVQPLEPARLKAERAKKHISDLHEAMVSLGGAGLYTLVVDKDPKSGRDRLCYEEKKLPRSDELALIVGDVLHNLRSALDIMVGEIVFARLGIRDKHTRFPVAETRDELERRINGGLIKKASPAVCDFIVGSVQPYKGGYGETLWSLHQLNILDKHRLLLPVLKVTGLRDVCFEDDRGVAFKAPTWIVTDSREFFVDPFHGHQNVKVTDKGKPTIFIWFDESVPMAGKPVIPTLIYLSKFVDAVVEEIRPVFMSGG